MRTVRASEDLARLAPSRAAVGGWLGQRLSAVALLILVPWVVFSLATIGSAEPEALRAWVAHPGHATALAGLFLAAYYHAALGLEVVIQDYVHPEHLVALLILGVRLAALAGALSAVAALVWLVTLP